MPWLCEGLRASGATFGVRMVRWVGCACHARLSRILL